MGVAGEHGHGAPSPERGGFKRREKETHTIGVKAFRFKLQALLNVRAQELEAVQQRFAVQQQRVVGFQQKLEQARDQVYQALHPTQPQSVEPVIANQRLHYVQFLKMQVTHLVEAIQQEERLLERIREEMRVAYTKKRSLERLAEKQKAAYLKEIERWEERETEDSVLARVGRHGQMPSP